MQHKIPILELDRCLVKVLEYTASLFFMLLMLMIHQGEEFWVDIPLLYLYHTECYRGIWVPQIDLDVRCIDPSCPPLNNQSWGCHQRASSFTLLRSDVHDWQKQLDKQYWSDISLCDLKAVIWSGFNRLFSSHPSLLVTDNYSLWWRGLVLASVSQWRTARN